ncbi:hypothetical protein SEA_SPEEDDEMON_1100 [Gordonia phage SpeedDemon]|nr:hypothetical protein SEA_SPEEDDEMON_1100 [Gordonia phage SpeedDemon]
MIPDPHRTVVANTTEHRMTVLRHDGLYRHLRFAKPGTGIWRFDLITWPGHLVITGDLEDFHFSRIDDMFEFFRGPVGGINPGYWAEKLRGPVEVKKYSPELVKRRVAESFMQRRHLLRQPTEVWRQIRIRILEDEYVMSEEALVREAIGDFYHGGLDFEGAWEWDFRDYDFHYLVALHAIVWGISTYDKQLSGNLPQGDAG